MSASQYTIPLRDALNHVIEHLTNSGLQQLLCYYIPRIAPTDAKGDRGEQHFPRGRYAHPSSNDRRCMYDGYGDVLHFHVQRAILGYYALVDDRGTLEDKAHILRFLDISEHFPNYVVCTTPTGSHLVNATELAVGETEPIDALITRLQFERQGQCVEEQGEFDDVSDSGESAPTIPTLPTGGPAGRCGDLRVVEPKQIPDGGGTPEGLVG